MPAFHKNPLAYAGPIPGFNVKQTYSWREAEDANADAQRQTEASAPAPSQHEIAPIPIRKQRKPRAKKSVCPPPQIDPVTAPATQQTPANAAGPSKKRGSGMTGKATKRKAAEVEPGPTVARPGKKGKVAHASATPVLATPSIVPSMQPPPQAAPPPRVAPLPLAAPPSRAAPRVQAVPPSVVAFGLDAFSAPPSLPQGNPLPSSVLALPGNASAVSARAPQSRPALLPAFARRPDAIEAFSSVPLRGHRLCPSAAPRDASVAAINVQQRLPPPPVASGTSSIAPQPFHLPSPVVVSAASASVPQRLPAPPPRAVPPRYASMAPRSMPQGVPAARTGPFARFPTWWELLDRALDVKDYVYAGKLLAHLAVLPESHPQKAAYNALMWSVLHPGEPLPLPPRAMEMNVAGPSRRPQYFPPQQTEPVMDSRAVRASAYSAGPAYPVEREAELEEMNSFHPINGVRQGEASGSDTQPGAPRLGTVELPIDLDEPEEYSIEDLYADA